MKKPRKQRSDKGKSRKFTLDKKESITLALSKPNVFFVKKVATLQGSNEAKVVDRMISRIRMNYRKEVDYLIKEYELKIEYLKHKEQKEKIENGS